MIWPGKRHTGWNMYVGLGLTVGWLLTMFSIAAHAADGPLKESAARAAMEPTAASAERIGDAWSDPRNPIVQLFGGRRLDLWSLKPVVRPKEPPVRHAGWVRNDLDRQVLARWEAAAADPPEAADRRMLIRRLCLDLTGLPPGPDEVAAFLEDTRDDAWERLVDRLLASDRFGQHLARRWLDVVRYSDSNGFDWDEFRSEAWRYRDYVIRSFNEDKPFDRFIREQLAGDELTSGPPQNDEQQDALIATGFLRLGPYDNSSKLFNEQDRARAEMLTDLVETTGSAFLGLTMACCRCHDHKYDPISQADYYRMRALFEAVNFADDLPLDLASEQQVIRTFNAGLDARMEPLRKQRDELLAGVKSRLGKPDAKGDALTSAMSDDEKKRDASLSAEIKSLEDQRRPFLHGLVATDNAQQIPETHVLFQGDLKSPREVVPPGFLSVLDPNPAVVTAPPNSQSSGRRLALANWIASPANPLTARVFVNRLWQHLMGSALVATPNDFGLAGAECHDPELLDWLASEFVRQDWSVKSLMRTIVTSATYRQAVTCEAAPSGIAYLCRVPRRLTAEQLRDALLQTAGLLTAKSGGPPVWPNLPREVLDANPALLDGDSDQAKAWHASDVAEQNARSIFLVQKRNTRVPLMETFDQPENSVSCACRNVSTGAPQAMTLLNSPLVAEVAVGFAARIEREAGADVERQVRRAYQLALLREPESAELAPSLKLVREHSLADLCRVLVNLNEFVYIE